MKTDDLLYGLMDEMSAEEMKVIDEIVSDEADMMGMHQRRVERNVLKRQENMTMARIAQEQKSEPSSNVRLFGKRKIVLLAATFILMIGMVAFAKEHDWDIEMAERIGLSGAMEELDGGYVKIGVSDTEDNITVTATQAIGDQNTQWIQLDTDIPWTLGDNGYYIFDEFHTTYTDNKGKQITGGATYYSFDNGGTVSLVLELIDVERINRANVSIVLGELRQYENMDVAYEDGTVISEATWELSWKNYYVSNTITKHPFTIIDGCLIHKIDISPISLKVEAVGLPFSSQEEVIVEAVTMEDGTVIESIDMVGTNTNNMFLGNYVMYQDKSVIDIDRIASITINGQDLVIH